MKRYFLYILLSLVILPACGQGISDYYQSSDRGHLYSRVVKRYGNPAIQSRWYAAVDGFIRTDRAQLDNSFNGQLESNRVTKAGWGAAVGWVYREKWAVEAGYSQMPIHTQISVVNTATPVNYRYTNNYGAFVLRGKRLVLSTSKPWLRSGLWLSGGLWAVSNGNEQNSIFQLSGHRYRYLRETIEPVQLSGYTTTNSLLSSMAEVGAEYNVRLSSKVDLGFSARAIFGLSPSTTTDITYVTSQKTLLQTQLRGTGTGMSFGTTLRYTFNTHRKTANVLEVQGKAPIVR